MALLSVLEPHPVKSSPKVLSTAPTLRSSVARRSYAASIKQIMHSRHANTGRKKFNNRSEIKQWIGEMVVVKLYDQRDSLRDVLDLPARLHPPCAPDEQAAQEEVVEEEIPSMTEVRIERTGKRKREGGDAGDEEKENENDENETKRLRIAGPTTRKVDADEVDGVAANAKKTFEVVIPSKSTRSSTGGQSLCSPATDESSTNDTCSTALVLPNEEYYSWPALLARVDHQFGITSPPIDTPT